MDNQATSNSEATSSSNVRFRKIALVAMCVAVGGAFGTAAFTFDYAEGTSYLSNDSRSCANCHIMQQHEPALGIALPGPQSRSIRFNIPVLLASAKESSLGIALARHRLKRGAQNFAERPPKQLLSGCAKQPLRCRPDFDHAVVPIEHKDAVAQTLV